MAEHDTVSEKYYKPVRRSEVVGYVLFLFGGVLSFLLFVISRDWDFLTEAVGLWVVEIVGPIFLTVSIALFFQGIAHRLYFYPRAEDARRANLLSDAFGVPISADESIGYYNNQLSEPISRLAANCMESSFFTKELARSMLGSVRVATASYLILYSVIVTFRKTEFEIVEIAAAIIFSEEVVSRWLRLEHLRLRSEKAYEKLYNLFAWKPETRPDFWYAQAVVSFALYETSKSTAAVPLSSRLFEKRNPQLSEEWRKLCEKLGIVDAQS